MIILILFVQKIMNPPFSGARSPIQNGNTPFYNPQKGMLSPTGAMLYQNSNGNMSGYVPNSNSKTLVTRSGIMDIQKQAHNSSACMKTNNQGPIGGSKFVTSPSNFGNNGGFPNYQGSFPNKGNSQMVKSSFHESKGSESTITSNQMPEKMPFFTNTPNRRAPRMSEGGIPETNQVPTSFPRDPPNVRQGNEKLTDSPLLKRPQFENNFFKNKGGEKEEKEKPRFEGVVGKSEIFGKSSLGKKRPITVNDFVKIKQLGSGKYGQVSLAMEKSTGFICALKKIQKKLLIQQEIIEQFIRELKIQTYLHHPNIIKMYGFFDDPTYIYIILEVGTGGQLYHQLRKSEPMTEAKAAVIMKQVCEAVNEIHSLKIIHRDIKPENIVLHDNVVKLCDFGWSVYQDNRLRTTFCGTPLYVCPQILKGKQYDQKIDIWSLGIMMYEMLVGENPFKITKQEQLIKIVKDQISIPSYVFVSREGRDFLDKCLRKNPLDRVNVKELIAHEFFVKNIDSSKDKKMNF